MVNNKSSFTNTQILSWLQYFSKKAGLDIEKIKIIDISKKKKNLIPTIETREFDTFFLTTYSTPLLNKPY